jgi:hypothetical protein
MQLRKSRFGGSSPWRSNYALLLDIGPTTLCLMARTTAHPDIEWLKADAVKISARRQSFTLKRSILNRQVGQSKSVGAAMAQSLRTVLDLASFGVLG